MTGPQVAVLDRFYCISKHTDVKKEASPAVLPCFTPLNGPQNWKTHRSTLLTFSFTAKRKLDSELAISPLMKAPRVRVPLVMMEHTSLLTTLSNLVGPGAEVCVCVCVRVCVCSCVYVFVVNELMQEK